MFGYISANLAALDKEQQTRYRAYYCGLCRVLREKYGQQGRSYSEEVAARIDAEVQRKMNDALARARQILTENRDKLDGLSALLIEKETIDRAQFERFMKGEQTLPEPEAAE